MRTCSKGLSSLIDGVSKPSTATGTPETKAISKGILDDGRRASTGAQRRAERGAGIFFELTDGRQL